MSRSILCATVFLIGAAACGLIQAATMPPPSPPQGLMISELTVDNPPGAPGSWVELYNPTNTSIAAKETTVVCNGTPVFSMPELAIPPKAIVLVRFGQVPEKAPKPEAALRDKNVATIVVAPVFPAGKVKSPADRKPGYCALFRSKDLSAAAMLDFLCWGDADKQEGIDASHRKWAEERNLWSPKGYVIPTGIVPRTGVLIPPVPAVFGRILFLKGTEGSWSWLVYGEDFATPGAGNQILPPNLCWPTDGDIIEWGQPFAVSWACQGIGSVKADVLPARLQVALDPHFETVLIDRKIPSDTVPLKGIDLDPGRYYARVKVETGSTNTAWSNTVFFRYHLDGKPPDAAP
jgi:hypothetical protein